MTDTSVLRPEEYAFFFENRFRFAGRGHPAVDAMFALASEWAANETTPPYAPATPPQLPQGVPPDPVSIVRMEVRLPPVPAVLLELQAAVQHEHVSVNQLGEIIAKDPGLTAWVLKLVNSPFYGFSTKVATVSAAVALLGTKQIQLLAAGGGLNALAVLLPRDLIDMERYWRHSIATGIAAQELWRLSGRAEGEQLFVAGLLHDCGRLALAYAAPKISQYLVQAAGSMAKPGYMAEQDFLGYDHARLGGVLMHRWSMPPLLVKSILRHHEMEDAARMPEAAAVHVANILTAALDITVDEGAYIGPLNADAWDVLGIAPQQLAFVAGRLRSKLDCLAAEVRR